MQKDFPFNSFYWKAGSVLKDGGQLLLTCGFESSTEINRLHHLGIVTGFDDLGTMDYFSLTFTHRDFSKFGDLKRYLEATV